MIKLKKNSGANNNRKKTRSRSLVKDEKTEIKVKKI